MTSSKRNKTPEAAGCNVSQADSPLIVSSFACYGAFIVYGACVAALGAALPSLAEATNKSNAAFGIAFTTRGIGYMIGTLASAWVLNVKDLSLSKPFMTCAALAVTGVATGIISDLKNFGAILALFFIQGLGFGGIDVMANCVMPELWGLRVQPWMQALHMCFGIGAIIGPSLVGSIGYRTAFIIIAVFSFFPLAFLVGLYINNLKNQNKQISEPISTSGDVVDTPTDVEEADSDINKLSTTAADTNIDSSSSTPVVAVPVPLALKLLITAFYFVYVGAESGYAGWIPTFALNENVTNSNSKAAYLSAYFWAALTGGRFLAIALAICLSATTMLRAQLTMATACVIMILFLAHVNYADCAGVSGFFGFALSAIFPLAMTIVADYGYTMDASTTTLFMVSSTLGESIVPVCIGIAMTHGGSMTLTYIEVICIGILVAIYFGMHHIGGINHSSSSGTMDESTGEAANSQNESGSPGSIEHSDSSAHLIVTHEDHNSSVTHTGIELQMMA